MDKEDNVDVSVIIPVHNAGSWLDECFTSISQQVHTLKIQISIFLDSCTDDSSEVVRTWTPKLRDLGYVVTTATETNEYPKGVGYAKNKAVEQSSGEFLCFLDADDTMMPTRIQKQYELTYLNRDAIVGSRFRRDPPGSTVRYTEWANNLTPTQLNTQIYTSHGPTVIMPTWFCHRTIIDRVSRFSESGKGTPEDLIFFYSHIRAGGRVLRVDEELLIYRYHPQAATFSVHEDTIWDLRMKEIQDQVLTSWESFTIWNAGKQGRKFYRSLSQENQAKVAAFCDVDVKKIGSYYTYEESSERPKPKVPIIHFKEAKRPLIICMKMAWNHHKCHKAALQDKTIPETMFGTLASRYH